MNVAVFVFYGACVLEKGYRRSSLCVIYMLVIWLSLRKSIIEIEDIFADGVRENLDIRHTLNTAVLTRDQCKRDKPERGKLRWQLKLDQWVSEGRLDSKLTANDEDNSQQAIPQVNRHLVPEIMDKQLHRSQQAISDTWAGDHIHNEIKYIPICKSSISRVLSTGYIDDVVVNRYLSLLNGQRHFTNSFCISTSVFDMLNNPTGYLKYVTTGGFFH